MTLALRTKLRGIDNGGGNSNFGGEDWFRISIVTEKCYPQFVLRRFAVIIAYLVLGVQSPLSIVNPWILLVIVFRSVYHNIPLPPSERDVMRVLLRIPAILLHLEGGGTCCHSEPKADNLYATSQSFMERDSSVASIPQNDTRESPIENLYIGAIINADKASKGGL